MSNSTSVDHNRICSNGMVSVVIPCFRQGKFLPDAIASLQKQTYTNWEAIIVDDGSPDDTAAIASTLRRADSRVRYIEKTYGGVSSARNAGIRASLGEFLQFLDADDLLDSRKFEEQISVMRSNPDVGIVYGNARYFRDGAFGKFNRGPYANGPDDNWIAEAWADTRPMLRKLTDRNLFPVCTPLLRHSVIELVGQFNEAFAALEDWEYWIRCTIHGVRFQFLEAEGTDAFIRMHGESATQDKQRMRMGRYMLRMLCHQRLQPGEPRDANLACLLNASHTLGNRDRIVHYNELSKACRSLRERLLVGVNELCNVGGPLNILARGLGQRLPWRIRHWLATKGLGFVDSQ